jgi:hypothetical protein
MMMIKIITKDHDSTVTCIVIGQACFVLGRISEIFEELVNLSSFESHYVSVTAFSNRDYTF